MTEPREIAERFPNVRVSPRGHLRADSLTQPLLRGMSGRAKPHSGDDGYRCALVTPFGRAVVYDREAGAKVGVGRTRWAVVAYDKGDEVIEVFDRRSERAARAAMKALRDETLWPWGDDPGPAPKPARAPRGGLVAIARAAARRLGLSASYAHGWLKAGRPPPADVAEAVAMLRRSNAYLTRTKGGSK